MIRPVWVFKNHRSVSLAILFVMAVAVQWMLSSTITFSQTSQNEIKSAKVAYKAGITKEDGGWKFTIKFDGKPRLQTFLMDTPRRLVVELNDATFNFKDKLVSASDNLFIDSRAGKVATDKSRLVLTLAKPIEISSTTINQIGDSERHEFAIVIRPSTKEQFANAISKQQALLGSSGEAVVKGDRVRAGPRKAGTFAIVIDSGHGGIDGGSVGTKTKILEKDITLKMGKQIGAFLEKSGTFEVSYTRTEDVFVSLKKRQQFAQRQKADLMISIHADSLKQSFVRGATVYTLAKKATDRLSRNLATSQNLADIVAGLAAPDAQDEVTDILADLTLRETTRFSRSFSAILVEGMRRNVKMIKNPQRAASFAVLKNAEIPSVLIEMGYLSNLEDEKLLSNEVWQLKTSRVIGQAIIDFFKGRQPNSN